MSKKPHIFNPIQSKKSKALPDGQKKTHEMIDYERRLFNDSNAKKMSRGAQNLDKCMGRAPGNNKRSQEVAKKPQGHE
jgi:hypothetical protein